MDKLRFIVDSIVDSGLVVGRNDDLEIPLGSLFTSVERTRFFCEGPERYSESVETAAHVHLTVREVHWYQQLIDAVPPGHTAGIALEGAGLDRLAELLGGCPSGELLSLVGRARADA